MTYLMGLGLCIFQIDKNTKANSLTVKNLDMEHITIKMVANIQGIF
jgi:hypothetical protein